MEYDIVDHELHEKLEKSGVVLILVVMEYDIVGGEGYSKEVCSYRS